MMKCYEQFRSSSINTTTTAASSDLIDDFNTWIDSANAQFFSLNPMMEATAPDS
jgi:hypothetical protein